MNRVDIYNVCKEICPTYSLGQISGQIRETSIVLERRMDLPSFNNDIGRWDQWQIHVYSPLSPLDVDKTIDNLIKNLKPKGAEVVNKVSGDRYDKSFNAFYTFLTIRTPITI